MRRLAALLLVVALAGCVTLGGRREGSREKSQEFLRPGQPNSLLEGLAGWLNEVARRST
jgi:hypothetical protein